MSVTYPQQEQKSATTCEHCGEHLQLVQGGWAYRYTQALLHLDRCMAGTTDHERHTAAQSMAAERRF